MRGSGKVEKGGEERRCLEEIVVLRFKDLSVGLRVNDDLAEEEELRKLVHRLRRPILSKRSGVRRRRKRRGIRQLKRRGERTGRLVLPQSRSD